MDEMGGLFEQFMRWYANEWYGYHGGWSLMWWNNR